MSTDSLNEGVVRLIAFAVILLLLVLWERWAALRRQRAHRSARWRTNLGIGAIDIMVLRAAYPAGAVGVAVVAQNYGWGAFNVLSIPVAAAVVAAVLLLDLVIYFQHRLFHAVPWLWRIHRVHHADPELDVSTALRFHPLESVFSMILKIGVVLLLGLPPLGVLIFEITLNAAAMFNHTNASLPTSLERWVRRLVVTPDMHRIHHSTYGAETNSNFGFSLSWWDRLFRTYRPSPRVSQTLMPIGLPDAAPSPTHIQLGPVLLMPFLSSRNRPRRRDVPPSV
jgi:sterol desaturase/sphingolipid hydroxylase (fatty acid hydroxylase superfamily)